MTIQELEAVMQEHGTVIRAIPLKIREVMDVRHAAEYEDGQVMYLEEYRRDMFVREYVLKNAGKFLIEPVHHTMSMVKFRSKFFDSIEDAVASLTRNGFEVSKQDAQMVLDKEQEQEMFRKGQMS